MSSLFHARAPLYPLALTLSYSAETLVSMSRTFNGILASHHPTTWDGIAALVSANDGYLSAPTRMMNARTMTKILQGRLPAVRRYRHRFWAMKKVMLEFWGSSSACVLQEGDRPLRTWCISRPMENL